ncbi:hypothetical protein BRYFOR_09539 [Marvinbryantia formatexigens DSM 14469]|uniref:Uncharacterized protein n=1 Tax=Marvinbryantia formatexigens DSM 14469 TaxID=478749 RepID=C6LLJ1_9FIRM|nr:FxLYD domain-containing protein [Marvinbryantia formatexigens]EET58531.1 hypothetical protein BRYFOR_09539 [Marvinbryantia formatexigens DSM 14469]UWO24902.1 FxLYD domain-containing protein [Marvinbryantia formatexigens DSM 14469]SDH15709.1 hypothetical protein SAMN05660368_03942 [Marvinbryantia formatexigens]
MKRKKLWALVLCAGLSAAVPSAAYAGEVVTEAETEAVETEAAEAEAPETEAADTVETEAAEASEDQLGAPTDFQIDPNTGEYSFNATDERVGYYFVRFYALDENGNETGEYITSSKRINGGKTGEYSGTLDLSGAAWGTYHVNLTSFAPAGTDYASPAPVTVSIQYGVDQTLERPELLAMTSGNQLELVVDWWTLCDYAFTQYMPEMKFTFYADAECTQEVQSETVDLQPLMDTLRKNPPGMIYIWGWSTSEGPHFYTITSDSNESTFAFKNDIYTYNLEPGTYYVTAQALSKDDYTKDSQVSTALEITLTDGECTEEYTAVTTELWTDPTLMDMPGANPGQQEDRVDTAAAQGISGLLLE